MSEEKVIMYDSPAAAQLVTVTGWKSADGRFFGDNEDLARFAGSTHRACKNNPYHPPHRTNGWCDLCHQENRNAKFSAKPTKLWEGEPLVSFDDDLYFFDEDSLIDHIVDHDLEIADMRLCICEPNMPSEIDPEDYFIDDLPEDGEIRDQDMLAAFELLNETIRKAEPLSWSEGKHAAVMPDDFIARVAEARKNAA
ncbi:hypothetical protein ACIGCM_03845 [Pseudomonas sp. NPDC078700]|uniref:hypothetical protein n=1 Tax=Pseudomonas sp. NPDC078700 TaxID=3364424 RepID=UPI0037CB5067